MNFKHFIESKTAPGVILCLSSLLAIIFANSPLNAAYEGFKNIPVMLQIGSFSIDKPLLLWINDGLMAIFFLLVGLEIKRELIEGHLSDYRQALLPAIAALGGLIAPALIYIYFNWNDPITIQGWAIPAATDIAFALGVLLMLGSRIPASLKVCLVALAIIDDLAAVIIIALFYTADISIISLAFSLIGLFVALVLNLKGVTKITPYVLLGIFIWACVLKSGVHATLAGVALGLIIPLRIKNENGQSPLKIMEHSLHSFVAFAVLPVFAFSNAGLSFSGLTIEKLLSPVTLGIGLGLFIGKQAGVMISTFIACRLGLCRLPDDVTWVQFYGMALLTGIGFTMSLFIGTLAFTDIEMATPVRLGVLIGSILSIIAGVAILARNKR